MAESKKFSDKINNADFENNTNLSVDEMATLASFPGLGYYSRTSLEDIINNFIVSHIGEGKVLKSVPRHEVAFWAQRAVQEFSYDILHAEKNIEFEVSASLSFPLPADFVNYVKITWVDAFGNDRTIQPSRRSNAKQGILQDQDFNALYDNDGNFMLDEPSRSVSRFQSGDAEELAQRALEDSYHLADETYDYYYSGYFGRRYGNDPQFQNTNGTFILDMLKGIVYLDSSFQQGDLISMRYISDGLCNNDDLNNVHVPKLAEDAVYAFILYNLAKIRPSSAGVAPMYQKEMRAKMRNAKIRLSNYKIEEIAQVMRGRAKWIKH